MYTLDSATLPATKYGARDYDVQALGAGGAWQTVAQVRGSTAGKVSSTITPITTTALRILISDSNDHSYSRLVAVEAFGS